MKTIKRLDPPFACTKCTFRTNWPASVVLHSKKHSSAKQVKTAPDKALAERHRQLVEAARTSLDALDVIRGALTGTLICVDDDMALTLVSEARSTLKAALKDETA